jgi:hypothetical protein
MKYASRNLSASLPSFVFLAVLVFASFCFPGCTSPAGVSEFAHTAQDALRQSSVLFHDIPESCVRRHADAAPITAAFMPEKSGAAQTSSEDPLCAAFGPRADALDKVGQTLTAYFAALQQLASFNASAVSSIGDKAGENAGYAANFNTTQADSVGKLAGLVTQVITERYQRATLLHLLRDADPAIASVTQALEDVVSKDYQGLLQEEQQSLTAEYQNVGDTGNAAMLLLLNRSYGDELTRLQRRKAAADALAHALGQIRDGHHQLALNASHLKPKELSMALQPYTARLQGLVPALQMCF